MGPFAKHHPPGDLPPLRELPKDHEGAHRAPHPAQEGVHQEDSRPPVVPEQVEPQIVGSVLGPKQQQGHVHRVDVRCEPAVMMGRYATIASLLLANTGRLRYSKRGHWAKQSAAGPHTLGGCRP